MRNYELLQEIDKSIPDFHTEEHDFDELCDILWKIGQLIRKERPEISAGKKEYTAQGMQRYK
jgi:hypothetical protein